uniref:Uncharacterized protein n=1 Tax=Stipa capillata TaxID=665498 RepID=A0A8F5V8V4_9POAL|nr:hypothetical protein [Stipa capillata]
MFQSFPTNKSFNGGIWSISISFMADSFFEDPATTLSGRSGNPSEISNQRTPTPLAPIPSLSCKSSNLSRLVNNSSFVLLISPFTFALHPLKHFLICCKCTQKASPILLLTTVHATKTPSSE